MSRKKLAAIVLAVYLLSFGPLLAMTAKFRLEESAIKYPMAIYIPLAYICIQNDLLFSYVLFWIGLGDPDLAEELEFEYSEYGLVIGF